ncbi:hypothetical protein B5F79_06530 [Olsenella sp. An285]|uniref:glycosyltransferase family 2 protein n=1 Tax=Olsenella sp. An285 TaxID=1965621 RepID=UPI000B3A98BE|nr:glycosyltransferase [Olsenella sp. An285]OUO46650.1 hypothetical protein B5F79_06530 [Olsenella sp. An285]
MGRNRDLVSVIVPVYNVEKHLDQCLESILGQTYRNLEILLIDDGSTDSSLEIMNRYAEQDPRIRVFHKENGGVSSARNMGLETMGGGYCTFVDADGHVSERYIERLYCGLRKYDADLSICGYCSVAPNEEARFSSDHDKQMSWVIPSTEFSFFENDCGSAHFVSWGALYKKSLISDLRFDESIFYSEDALFFTNYKVRSKKAFV